jgi:hypothetical protein
MHSELHNVEANLTRLARRVQELGLESLTPSERTGLLAYVGHSVVAKGGFKQFYLTEFPLEELIAALRALRLSALADVALSTASQFSDPALADQPLARRAQVDGLQTDRQDYAFFRLSSEALLTAVAKFWKRTPSTTVAATR